MEELKEVRGYSVNSTSVVIVWDRPAIPVDVRTHNIYIINIINISIYKFSTINT